MAGRWQQRRGWPQLRQLLLSRRYWGQLLARPAALPACRRAASRPRRRQRRLIRLRGGAHPRHSPRTALPPARKRSAAAEPSARSHGPAPAAGGPSQSHHVQQGSVCRHGSNALCAAEEACGCQPGCASRPCGESGRAHAGAGFGQQPGGAGQGRRRGRGRRPRAEGPRAAGAVRPAAVAPLGEPATPAAPKVSLRFCTIGYFH